MKARFSEAGLDLQIILNCENDDERLLLREFLRKREDKNMELFIHSFGRQTSQPGWQHMSFGFKKQC